MSPQPILLAGGWRSAGPGDSFRAQNPATGEALPDEFPVSPWSDCDTALTAAAEAADALRNLPPELIAQFLFRYAERLEERRAELVETAHMETALPKAPRLAEVELPRTTNQLRQAAAAVQEGSWALPTIDTQLNIRSVLGPLGPVLVFGPNNFPFAYNGIAGGDFVAAIAAGNPVIAKAHPGHPKTTQLLAAEAFAAVQAIGLPAATVQMVYHFAPEDGLRFVADHRLGAAGFTGSRAAGLKLKAAADAVGKPIYLEMSSVNPVLILPGALAARGDAIAGEFTASCLAAGGQFCTSPGLTMLFAGKDAEQFIDDVKAKLDKTDPVPLLASSVAQNLAASVQALRQAGAELVTGGTPLPGNRFANTLLHVSGEKFLSAPQNLQREAFGNASLIVVARHADEAAAILSRLEGNLTGSIYSDSDGKDDALYSKLAPLLRARVGRLLNDKMPTGVAVTAAMNHGGPFPATGHPGFTAVGIPAALRRFTMLQCFDHVREPRLPAALRNRNPNGKMWRLIDGAWSQRDLPG
ncbi:MAG TPA: aldehyde dehydrogenase family protein [Candidatus Acidoferrales bacterium]|nr:aldehyde dehydrogenase family protein [Candidatus Acidoferrales bacterium]